MNASVPLEEALPWSPDTPRIVLIADSMETDGRFLLHTLAHQVLKGATGSAAAESRLWWIIGSPTTEVQVANGLKKIGSDVAASYLRSASGANKNQRPSPLRLDSLPSQIATQCVEADDEGVFDGETFLRKLYKDIVVWNGNKSTGNTVRWLILDDVSSLANILGENLVYEFVDSVCALAAKSSFGLVLRCSNDMDQLLLKASQVDEAKDKTGWIGAGGLAHRNHLKRLHEDWVPWERSLVESSIDAIIDVVPLTSGFSREAHGRLILTESPFGRGWKEGAAEKVTSGPQNSAIAWNKSIMNYCIQDNSVRAIRLREKAATRA